MGHLYASLSFTHMYLHVYHTLTAHIHTLTHTPTAIPCSALCHFPEKLINTHTGQNTHTSGQNTHTQLGKTHTHIWAKHTHTHIWESSKHTLTHTHTPEC